MPHIPTLSRQGLSMFKRRNVVGIAGFVVLVIVALLIIAAKMPSHQRQRAGSLTAFNAGNYNDAFEGFRKLALDPSDDASQVGLDLDMACAALRHLGRSDEADELREAVIEAHRDNWRLLDSAAQSYGNAEHFGYVVAGKFHRGNYLGGGDYVGCAARDRARAMQLMQQALPLVAKEADNHVLSEFYHRFAGLVLGHNAHLEYLTDFSAMPDFEDARHWHPYEPSAPVDADDSPIYYLKPEQYEAAKNDGERWRWLLAQVGALEPSRANEMDRAMANFVQMHFAQPKARRGWGAGGGAVGDDKSTVKGGAFDSSTLEDDETIAHLTGGIRRIKLPDEFNCIKIYERIAARGRSELGARARDQLAMIYEDRGQYDKAAAAWKTAIDEYGPGENQFRQQSFEQLISNWGRFEPGRAQPAGANAVVYFRYRNGRKVSFEAREINVAKLLDDMKSYLSNHKGQADWNAIDISNIGHRLVENNQTEYLGEQVAAWDQELQPRGNHTDERIAVITPLTKAGAYLLSAQLADGNSSRIVVWLSDTVIVKKNLGGKMFYYVCDAVNGLPVPGARLDFFGWKQVQVQPRSNNWRIETAAFSDKTDEAGQFILGADKLRGDLQWVVIARKDKNDRELERFAYLGFSSAWLGQQFGTEEKTPRAFVITDQPVYRSGQTGKYKLWIRRAKYDQSDTADVAGQQVLVRIKNPKTETISDNRLKADEYGGVAGEFSLPAGAMPGTYTLEAVDFGAGSFRVEEYSKPEFEVKVETPRQPVLLGGKIEATITAKDSAGGPISQAAVKYRVLRNSYSMRSNPAGDWDWLYGPGYGLSNSGYSWYPDFQEWGMGRPVASSTYGTNQESEVVLEAEVPIGMDGKVKVTVDTSPAHELHGRQDQQYVITAEVVDDSSHAVVGSGSVLATHKPFEVCAWIDRGYCHVGDSIEAHFLAQTLDQKPLRGRGELTLNAISYDLANQPSEKVIAAWKVDTNAVGQAQQKIKVGKAGQFRLSYKVTDTGGHTVEGGHVFVVYGEGFDGKECRFSDLELSTDKREYAPGDKLRLRVNTNKADGAVLLFVRPANGVYQPPKLLKLKGKSVEEVIEVTQKDTPNFFIEAIRVADGQVHTETREVLVPPENRVLKVEVLPSAAAYLPGGQAVVKVKLTDRSGKPVVGSTTLTIYDKTVEELAGGSNVPEIKPFFWQGRRIHYPITETSLNHYLGNLVRSKERAMADLGSLGPYPPDEVPKEQADVPPPPVPSFAPAGAAAAPGGGPIAPNAISIWNLPKRVPPPSAATVQTNRQAFADHAYWSADVATNAEGVAEFALTMPEMPAVWKIKVWAMSQDTKVGQGEAEIVTRN